MDKLDKGWNIIYVAESTDPNQNTHSNQNLNVLSDSGGLHINTLPK
jgi:hypothetical protein